MKENEQKLPRMVIENKGVGAVYERQFFYDIEKAILDGYRIAKNDKMKDVTMRNFNGFLGRAVLYLDGCEDFLVNEKRNPPTEIIKSKSVLDDIPTFGIVADTEEKVPKETYSKEKLDSMTKKQDILDYFKTLDLTVPDTTATAQQLKKVIKDTYKE